MLTMSIDDVQGGADGADDHAHDFQAKEEIRPEPAVPVDVVARDAEAVDAGAAENELRDDEHDSELRLVDSSVATGHGARGPVGEEARDDEAEQRADEGARVQIARLLLVEEERRAQEDGRQHDADEHGPADQRALDQTGLADNINDKPSSVRKADVGDNPPRQ